MAAWILVFYLNTYDSVQPVVMTQEFNTAEACREAGTRLWEFSSRRALWSCMKK